MIVLDMKMPWNCNECPFAREDNQLRDYCVVLPQGEDRIQDLMRRLENCPIKAEIRTKNRSSFEKGREVDQKEAKFITETEAINAVCVEENFYRQPRDKEIFNRIKKNIREITH